MEYDEYRKLYAEVLQLDEEFDTVLLPVELQDGEAPDEGFRRFLIEEGLIEARADRWRIKDREKVEKFDPNLLKILDAMVMASFRAEMDSLQEEGLVYMTADSDGNITYELTEEGWLKFGN